MVATGSPLAVCPPAIPRARAAAASPAVREPASPAAAILRPHLGERSCRGQGKGGVWLSGERELVGVWRGRRASVSMPRRRWGHGQRRT